MPKISIGTVEYNYRIRLSKRSRYIRIQLSQERGIELIVPKGVSIANAEKFLSEKKDWILKKFVKIKEKNDDYMLFGEKINLERQFDLFLKKPKIELIKQKLLLTMPEGKDVQERKIFEEWLKAKAEEYIPNRVKVLAEKNVFNFNKVVIRGQKSRWGSCSKYGNLSFNFKVMSYKKEVIDYLIIHELCHLKEMNHSGKFWHLVESYMPDYKDYKNILKEIS